MKFVSPLTELCAAFRCCDSQLRFALSGGGTPSAHARLLLKTTELLDQIERFEPSATEELEELLDFLARRRMETAIGGLADFDRIARTVVSYRDRELAPRISKGLRKKPAPDLLSTTLEGAELAKVVVRAEARMIAIGRDRRILAVSASEAAYRNSTPGRIAGRHILEVVGCSHTTVNKMRRIALAFGGRPQMRDCLPARPENSPMLRKTTVGIRDRADRIYAVVVRIDPVPVDQRSAETT